MKYIATLAVIVSVQINSIAQNVGIGTNTPHANAQLDIYGVNKGLLIPRGDNATRTALNSNTAKGLLMYDTVSNALWVHNGNGLASGWNNISIGTNYWIQQGLGGAEIANTNTGGFWSANPTAVLSDPGVITPPVSGAGTRLMWIPAKSAFRAGTADGVQWDAGNIGSWSFAAGRGTIASGTYSIAMGDGTNALGHGSTAMGAETVANGNYSTAMGYNTTASGFYSTAMGYATTASGNNSTAMGYATTASGNSSTAMGFLTTASGIISTAMGVENNSRAYNSLAIGRYNDSISSSNTTAWINTDPLFYIGNGTANNDRHNAMVVYKNGNTVLKNQTSVLSDPGVVTPPVSGAGTRMMWIPEKSAFRAGTVSGVQWDAGNIGTWSFASGRSTIASGNYSTAMGYLTTASGISSTAMGYFTTASGDYSTAMGNATTASGNISTAMGYATTASDLYSTAMGYFTTASGAFSTAMGVYNTSRAYGSLALGRYNDSISSSNSASWINTDPLFYIGNGTADNARHNAMVVYKNGNTVLKNPTTVITNPGVIAVPVSGAGTRMMWIPEKSAFRAGTVDGVEWDAGNIGNWSFAVGSNTIASGNVSTAMGTFTNASGSFSTAMGGGNTSRAYGSLAIGRYNDSISSSSTTTWISTDPVFYIGNGTADNARSNAAVIYKNGNADINGFTKLGTAASGAPAIKTKKLTLTLNASANGSVAHGLTESKILSIRVRVANQFNSVVFDGSSIGSNAFNAYLNAGNVVIQSVAGNNGDIVNRPAIVVIIYEE